MGCECRIPVRSYVRLPNARGRGHLEVERLEVIPQHTSLSYPPNPLSCSVSDEDMGNT